MLTAEKRCYTKICAIRSCKYSIGTRDEIQMFNVPTEESRLKEWSKSAGLSDNERLRGFVCFEHFTANDFTSSIKNRRLKPGAKPTIFNAIPENEPTILNNIISIKDNNHQCFDLREECDNLKKEISTIRANYDIRIAKLEAKLKFVYEKNQSHNTELKSLRASKEYAKKKIDELKISNNQLLRKNKSFKDFVDAWKELHQSEILKCLAFGIKSGQSYPAEVRKFCLELHFHRPAAYKYVRRIFGNNLPSERTIAMWYQVSDINQANGICELAFDRLAHIVEQLNGKKLICSLIFDEVYIRKQILRCRETSKYVGYVTYGSGAPPAIGNEEREEEEEEEEEDGNDDRDEQEELPCANQAIVFMLCGLNLHFKLPIAYEFIKSLNGYQRADLVMAIIKRVTKAGVRISNLTFDGYLANHKMCEILGANLDIDSDDFRPFIENPVDKNKIYIIKDPSHMHKLVRNTLAGKEVLFDEKNEQIRWKHIEDLEKLGRTDQFLTHKLTKRHIQYKKSIMDVPIARQTLSGPVADSLQYLQKNQFPLFENCQASIKFIRTMDKIASVFNSRSTDEIDPFKNPLCPGNIRIVRTFFSECVPFLKSLKVMDKKNKKKIQIIKSVRKTGFIGTIINIKSILLMYEEYVEGGLMDVLSAYSIIQDHLEAFFGHMRARQGSNDNPNVIEFKAGWRKLLCGSLEVFHSKHSNVELQNISLPELPSFTNIYSVSSRRQKFNEAEKQKIKEQAEQKEESIREELRKLELAEDNSAVDLKKASIAFLAKSIEVKVENVYDFSCEPCKQTFPENVKMIDCFSKAEDLAPPCASTFQICEIADTFLKLHQPHNAHKYEFNVLYWLIFRELKYETLYVQSEHFKEHEDHKYHLIKCIINEYVETKLSQMCQQRTLSEYDRIVRKVNTKSTHFAGQ